MKLVVLVAVLTLAGCASQQRGPNASQLMAADPTNECMAALVKDSTIIEQLGDKLGIGQRGDPTVEMLTDKTYPSDAQKAAISRYSAGRSQCIAQGSAYRAGNLPPPVTTAMESSGRLATLLYAQLYSGEITYADFNRRRMEMVAQLRADLTAYDQRRAADMAASEQQRQRALNAALQNFSAQQAQQQMLMNQQLQQQQINMPRTTNCYRNGNLTNCTTY